MKVPSRGEGATHRDRLPSRPRARHAAIPRAREGRLLGAAGSLRRRRRAQRAPPGDAAAGGRRRAATAGDRAARLDVLAASGLLRGAAARPRRWLAGRAAWRLPIPLGGVSLINASAFPLFSSSTSRAGRHIACFALHGSGCGSTRITVFMRCLCAKPDRPFPWSIGAHCRSLVAQLEHFEKKICRRGAATRTVRTTRAGGDVLGTL